MKFTKEDGIITAKEATERSKSGIEDSTVREQVRIAMVRVKRISSYGYNKIEGRTFIGHSKLEDKTIEILEYFGYSVSQFVDISSTNFNRNGGFNKNKVEYKWIIAWPKVD